MTIDKMILPIPATFDRAHERYLRLQVAIGICINAFVPTTIIWFIGVSPPDSLWGHHPMIPGMIMGAGLATFCMTVGLTLVVKADIRRGRLHPVSSDFMGYPYRLLPQSLLLRGLCVAVMTICALVPSGVLVLYATPILPLSAAGLVAWNVCYGAMAALIAAPLVVVRALAEAP